MPFAGGDGSPNNKFQIGTVAHFNSINDEADDAQFELINDIDAAGETLDFVLYSDRVIDGGGYQIKNIESVSLWLLFINIDISNIRLHFNWTASHDQLMSPFGASCRGTDVEITGDIVNTHANGDVAGYAERGRDSARIAVYANLSAHNTIYGICKYSAYSGIDQAIFAGTMTDLSGSAIRIGTQGNSEGGVETEGASLFWDSELSGTNLTYDANAGGKTTSQLQDISNYQSAYSETYSAACVIDGTTIKKYPGVGHPGFPFSVGETVYIYGSPFEIATVVDAGEATLTQAPTSSIISITGETFGSTDGTQDQFPLAENAVQEGTETIYIDGVETSAYSIAEVSGDITFDTPPANGVVLTADYDYSLEIPISQGTGFYNLAQSFNIATVSGFDGSQDWVIDDGIGYPQLGAFATPVAILSGIVSFSGNPIADSVVAIMRATNPFDVSTHEVVEFTTADGNGVYTVTAQTDPLYDYWVSPVGFQSEFTGTISSVTNEFITLPSDLSGISMGGVNDQSYYIKGVTGPGAGTAFKVIGRSGNTIELAVAPAFDNTTTFDLGKAYFPGQPFSKTALT